MVTVCEKNKCNGCMACVSVCPRKCVTVTDGIAFYNAFIDKNACISCHKCEKVCPQIAHVKKNTPIEWVQGWAGPQIRKNSSSGGAASAILNAFIRNGGFVASCVYRNGEFVFELTDEVEAAKKFAGSKYVKSNPIGIYQLIDNKLQHGEVLFIGLPCQVAALKNYVRNTENLFTIDLICHGTPSPKLLEKFLDENKIDIRSIHSVKFRNNISMGLSTDGVRVTPEGTDDYMVTFLDGVNYTENCYSCQYAAFDRVGDLTLGDCWGTEFTDEERDGVSLILIQNEKGRRLLRMAELTLKTVDIDRAIQQNHQLQHPTPKSKKHDSFFSLLDKGYSYKMITILLYKKEILKRYVKKFLIKIGLRKIH